MITKLSAAVLGLGMLGVAAIASAHEPHKFHASIDGYQAVPALSPGFFGQRHAPGPQRLDDRLLSEV